MIPDARAHAGIARAIARGAINFTDDDQPMAIIANPSLPAASAPRDKGAPSVVGHAASAADTRAIRQGGVSDFSAASTSAPAHLIAKKSGGGSNEFSRGVSGA